MSEKKWYLGDIKKFGGKVFLRDFNWDCGWYWAGGYISAPGMHAHFDGCFMEKVDKYHSLLPSSDQSSYGLHEDLSFFLDNPQYTKRQWWRVKDLFVQFYALKKAAEVFRYGGHCTHQWRTNKETNPIMAQALNRQIETVIIPEVQKVMGDYYTYKRNW